MTEMRYTVIDGRGAASFVGPAHVLKMLVAACATSPVDLAALLGQLRRYDAAYADFVSDGLARFDEHYVDGNAGGPDLVADEAAARPVFRVIDAVTRQASLQPVGAGAVLFNLTERRIVQLQNSYAEIERTDRGRLRRNGRPVQTYYFYTLPDVWQIVP